MTFYLESFWPVLALCLGLLICYLRVRRRFSVARLVMVAGFSIYLMQVASYTIFPLDFGTSYVESLRQHRTFLSGMNLVPFKDLSIKYLISVQGWGNVALGMPFGFMLPFVVSVSGWRRMAVRGLLFGSTIELVQLLISLLYGFPYRVIDVNDIMLNFAGVMIGYAFLQGMAFLYQAAVDGNSPEARSWAHVRSVLNR